MNQPILHSLGASSKSSAKLLVFGKIVLFIAGDIFFESAHAIEINYNLTGGIEYSDNVTRAASGQVGEWISSLAAELTAEHHSPSLNTAFNSRIHHQSYRNRTYADEIRWGLDTITTWALSPDRASIVVEDYFSQSLIDPQAPITPDNIQDANIFITGPDFTMRFGSRSQFQFGGRYMDNYYEISDADNKRLNAYARWRIQRSSVSNYSINYERNWVDFENDLSYPDYGKNDLFFKLERVTGSSETEIDLGVSRIERTGDAPFDGPLGRFSWTRRVTQESSIEVAASSEYSDAGLTLRETGSSGGGDIIDTRSGEIFFQKRAAVSYRRVGQFSSASISVYIAELDYLLATTPDEDRRGMELAWQYRFQQDLIGRLTANYRITNYILPIRDDYDRELTASLIYHASQNTNLRAEFTHTTRHSTDVGQEFEELRAGLFLTYQTRAIQ